VRNGSREIFSVLVLCEAEKCVEAKRATCVFLVSHTCVPGFGLFLGGEFCSGEFSDRLQNLTDRQGNVDLLCTTSP
jgi:hypothetical protein